MDSEEAKVVLQAYRPGIAVDDDKISEALELARRDSILAAWWEDQCALHEAFEAKFREVPVPDGLRERILAGRRISEPIPWLRSRATLAAAAAVVLLTAVFATVFRMQAGDDLRTYRRDMAQFVSDLYKMNVQVSSWEELRQAFAEQGWPSDYVVPGALRSVTLKGGCVLYWRKEKVSLICMETREGKGMWLFVANKAMFANAPSKLAPQLAKAGQLRTAAWSEGDNVYLLATEDAAANLRNLL